MMTLTQSTPLNRRLAWIVPIIAAVISLFPATAHAQPREVMKASAQAQRVKTAPGDQFALAVVLDFEDGWHAWPNKPVLPKGFEDLLAIPTEVSLGKGAVLPDGVAVHFGHAQWPEAHEIESAGFTGEPLKVLSYSGRAIVCVPVTIGVNAAPGVVTLPLDIHYQACDDSMCMQPTTATATATFEIVAGGGSTENTAAASDFAAFQPAVFAKILSDTSKPPVATPAPAPAAAPAQNGRPPTTLFGYELPDPSSPAGIAVLLLVSILGGAVMNLTPCVLPVIPIKIMTLTQHAKSGHGTGGAIRLGLWMALGIVVFWTAIGVPMAFISAGLDPSRFIFGTWWVTFTLGLIIVLMGLGIMGMFNLTLPQSVYKINPKADTAWGSFVFGIMTAILGLPCFGFVAGGLLAAAATMPALSTMSVFFGMGVGMAAPFLVLSAKPELVSKMPRTGPASELVKQVMGLMLLAAAAFFIATGMRTLMMSKPYLGPTMRWWAVAFFLTIAGVWLIVRTFQISKNPARRLVFSTFAVALGFFSLAMAWSETQVERANYIKLQEGNAHDDSFVTGAWNHYTPAKFEKARESGKIVVADFTAEWCLICKSLKKGVLDIDPVNREIMKEDVVVFEVDLSDEAAPGWKFLNSLGRTGIPTLAVFTPGVETPEIFNAYTKQNVVDAMARARAKARLATDAASDGLVTGDWNLYTPAKFEQARASDRIIIANFTADWCLHSKYPYRDLLKQDPVRAEVAKDDVVLLEVDCSRADAPGWALVEDLGAPSVPSLFIFTPGVEQPEMIKGGTAAAFLEALERARASERVATAP